MRIWMQCVASPYTRTLLHQNCDNIVFRDVVDGTDYSQFFLEEKSGKVYTTAEAITWLHDRVFTIEWTIDLTHAHFDEICELAQARIELEHKQRLVQEQQLRQRQ